MVNGQTRREAHEVLKKREIVNILRDRLTPLCFEIARTVQSEAPEEILKGYVGSTNKPHEPYVKPTGDLYMAASRVKLEAGTINLGELSGMYEVAGRYPNGKEEWLMNAPLGYYGADFAKSLAYTAGFVGNTVPDLAAIDHVIDETISGFKTKIKLDLGLYKGLISDGVGSVGDSFRLLTVEKVPGFENPVEAIEALTRDGLPNRLSLAMPFGLMGMLLRYNGYIPGILETDGDGRLTLSGNFIKDLDTLRRSGTFDYYFESSSAVGLGCPVGKKMSGKERTGIQALTEAFLRVFKIVYESGITASKSPDKLGGDLDEKTWMPTSRGFSQATS